MNVSLIVAAGVITNIVLVFSLCKTRGKQLLKNSWYGVTMIHDPELRLVLKWEYCLRIRHLNLFTCL